MADPFALPFVEAIDYFEGKLPLGADAVRSIKAEARDRAFWIAGVTNQQVVESAYTQIHKALAEGETFDTFKKTVNARLQALGYDKLKPFRLRTIFETNMASAYAAGQWRRATDPEVIKRRPYGRYRAIMDSRTRPTHAGLNGRVWPLDDPAWGAIWPPNGFRCRCMVDTISETETNARGLKVERSAEGAVLVEATDPVTGHAMPAQQFRPAKGFDHNPGIKAWGEPIARQALKQYKQDGGWKLAVNKDWQTYGRPRNLPLAQPPGPQAKLGSDIGQVMRATLGGDQRVYRDSKGQPVLAVAKMADHLFGPGKRGRERFIPWLPDVIEQPQEIWLRPMVSERNGQVILRKTYVKTYDVAAGKGRGMAVVVDCQKGVWVSWTTYTNQRVIKMNRERKGVLL